MAEQKPLRLTFLIVGLIAALMYRFPIEIQKAIIVSRQFIEENMPVVQTLFTGDEGKGKKSNKKKTSGTSPKIILDKTKMIIVKLNNGGQIEGVIQGKNAEGIVIDVGYGTVVISNRDIKEIKVPTENEKDNIIKGLEQKGEDKKKIGTVTEIRYRDRERIIVNTLLNDEVKAVLIMDTGAPYVVISPKIAEQLFDIDKVVSKNVKMGWTDGRTTEGKMVLLQSVKVGNVRSHNVKAVVAEIAILDPGTDGLLGMSFLNNFNVKIDARNKKVVLDKR